VRSIAVIGLTILALLDLGGVVAGVALVESLALDPLRPQLVGWIRGVVAAAVVGGGGVLVGLLAVAAAAGIGARSPVASWLGVVVGTLHVAVPVVGLAVIGATAQLIREEANP